MEEQKQSDMQSQEVAGMNAGELVRVTRLDNVPHEKVEYTQEGFLIDHPIVTSVGIFEYTNPDGSIRKELRLPEHVFDEKSLATYEGKPVIVTHDAGRVNKDNVTNEIVGTMLSKGYGDDNGNDVRVKIVIHDIDTVKKSGMRELSLGYDLVLDETPGEWNGQPYDAIQTEIVINHLAIVREARAGEQARLNIDSRNNLQKGAKNMRKDESEKIKDDSESKTVEEIKENTDNTDNYIKEEPIDKILELVKDRRDRRDKNTDEIDDKATIAELKEDIECLLKIVEKLQASYDMATADAKKSKDNEKKGNDDAGMNADSIDEIIAERLKLGRLGDKLNLDGLETLKPLEAKKRIISAIKPDLRFDNKGKDYIDTAFDIAVQELDRRKDTEYQRQQMFNGDGNGNADYGVSKAQKAREAMLTRMQKGE